MSDFQKFISTNDILKKDIASYLGVSNAFITQLSSGTKRIPADKLALIKANPYGWDISMLDDSSRNVTVGDNATGVIVNSNNVHQDNRQYYSDSPDVLRAQIDLLDERLKEKDAQIKEMDAQIKEKDAQIKEKDAQINRLLDLLQSMQK